MKLKDLNNAQRGHLVWRLDKKTGCGLLTACAIAKGRYEDWNDREVFEIFMEFNKTSRSAKIHAKKVENFMKVL